MCPNAVVPEEYLRRPLRSHVTPVNHDNRKLTEITAIRLNLTKTAGKRMLRKDIYLKAWIRVIVFIQTTHFKPTLLKNFTDEDG
jgi:hypothetical protein